MKEELDLSSIGKIFIQLLCVVIEIIADEGTKFVILVKKRKKQ